MMISYGIDFDESSILGTVPYLMHDAYGVETD